MTTFSRPLRATKPPEVAGDFQPIYLPQSGGPIRHDDQALLKNPYFQVGVMLGVGW